MYILILLHMFPNIISLSQELHPKALLEIFLIPMGVPWLLLLLVMRLSDSYSPMTCCCLGSFVLGVLCAEVV